MKTRLLANFLWITACFSLVYVLISVIIEFYSGVTMMLINFAIFMATFFAFVTKKISYNLAAHAYMVNACFVAVFSCTYASGGLLSPVLPWFLLVSVISLLLFGRGRETWVWFGIALAIVLSFGIIALSGHELPARYNHEYSNFFMLTCMMGLMAIIFIVTMIFEKAKDHALSKVQEKSTEILDSIVYAKNIQDSILPPEKTVRHYLEDSFILYKPKDIVAGDFYWMESRAIGGDENYQGDDTSMCSLDAVVLFAAADCTGHGVPGALVSVVCSNALKRATREYQLTKPSDILDRTADIVIEHFSKTENDIKDGMDVSLFSLNTRTLELEFSGAHNSLLLVRKDSKEIEVLRADRQPIGNYDFRRPFTNRTAQLQRGDTIYMATDGYPDQFGGPEGKKLKTKQFRDLLLSIVNEPLQKQKEILNRRFEEWRGDFEQVDDVCVVGVRL